MEITVVYAHTSPVIDEFLEKLAVISLCRYASEAAGEMEFESPDELQDAIKRAVEIFIAAELPLKGNFQRVYKSSEQGILYDWKLSSLAYRMVCLCGNASNPHVASEMIRMVKQNHLHGLTKN